MPLSASVKLQVERGLQTKEAKYHIRTPLVRTWSIPKGAISFEATSIFQNNKVSIILICCGCN